GGRGGDGVLDLGFLWVWIPAGGLAAPAGGTGATARTCPGRPRSAPGPGPLEPVGGLDLPAGLVGPRPGFPGRLPPGRRRVLPRRAGGTDSVPDAGGLGGGGPDRALREAAVRRAAMPHGPRPVHRRRRRRWPLRGDGPLPVPPACLRLARRRVAKRSPGVMSEVRFRSGRPRTRRCSRARPILAFQGMMSSRGRGG